jgi:hypothetical protein
MAFLVSVCVSQRPTGGAQEHRKGAAGKAHVQKLFAKKKSGGEHFLFIAFFGRFSA